MRFLFLLRYLPCLSAGAAPSWLQLYNALQGVILANNFQLLVNSRKSFVCNTRPAAFSYCSFSGSVALRIVCPGIIQEFDLRPISRQIQARAYCNKLRVMLTQHAT